MPDCSTSVLKKAGCQEKDGALTSLVRIALLSSEENVEGLREAGVQSLRDDDPGFDSACEV
jgi:hypothetical protein